MPTFSYNTILPIAGLDANGRFYTRGNVTTLTAPTSRDNVNSLSTTEWLHLDFGTSLHSDSAFAELHQRYPSLASLSSFAAIVDYSAKYLKTNAGILAAAHAERYFSTNPRLSLSTVAADTAQASSMGLLAFLTSRSELLRPVTIQPSGPLAPDPRPDLPSCPTRPPDATLGNFYALHNGATINPPDGFVPDGCPYHPPKNPALALAVEFHHNKDHRNGLSIVFPLAEAQRLFRDANLPLNSTPTSIVAATDKPEGRLTVDSTRSGINHPNKKRLLSEQHGPINNPTHADWCRLFAAIRRLFRGHDLVLFKADFDRWFKRIRIHPMFVGLLAMLFHIDGAPFVVIPLAGQFGCQEFNYMSAQVAAVIHARVRHNDIALFNTPLSFCYVDDTAGMIPVEFYALHDIHFTAEAVAHAGTNAAPPTKKDHGKILTVIGARYDITDHTNERIGIPESLFVKLVCVFFQECPRRLVPGVTRLKYKFYQRMGSYMCMASNYITWLRPHTHAVYDNICYFTNNPFHVTINARTAIDIGYWRWALLSTQSSTNWLDVPTSVPPLMSRPKDQSDADFATFQASQAHFIVGTDAATFTLASPTWGAGWTSHRPGEKYNAWGQYFPDSFATFLRSISLVLPSKSLAKLDQINFYEAIAMVLACHAILSSLPADRPKHVVLFVWCDNTSAIAWLTKFKNDHPVINLLLQVWSRLQCKYDASILSGHIRGIDNKNPDAISRNWEVPDGLNIREMLSHMVPHLSLPAWFHSLLRCSTAPSDTAWQQVADLLMLLEETL